MAHQYRFFIPPETPDQPEIQLPPDEAHHAIHVVRVQTGENVSLFDGQGREILGTVTQATKRAVTIRTGEVRQIPRPKSELTLLQAWLHRDKTTEFVIRRGTELGVSRFIFFRAQHSEKTPRMNPKWDRIVIEACKQCGHVWLPTFRCAKNLEDALDTIEGDLLIAAMHRPAIPLSHAVGTNPITLLVGPEGDFSHPEIEAAIAHGAQCISLGETTFRAEVAATHALTLIQYHRGALGPR